MFHCSTSLSNTRAELYVSAEEAVHVKPTMEKIIYNECIDEADNVPINVMQFLHFTN